MRKWLAQRLPWWAPMALWLPAVVIAGVFAPVVLLTGAVLSVRAIVETDGGIAFRAVWSLAAGTSAAVWFFRQLPAWRTLTPSALQGKQSERRHRRRKPGRLGIIGEFRQGLAEGRQQHG